MQTERPAFKHFCAISTRWKDNDSYAHVNNAEYYSYFDSAINGYLIRNGGLDLQQPEQIGICAESHCKFLSEVSFPQLIDAGIRVEHLGSSSVRYGIGLFREGQPDAFAVGWFVHVFVDPKSRRPSPMRPGLRAALELLVVEGTN